MNVIVAKMLTIAPEIFKKRNILFAYLYGSIALGQSHRFSDMDIGVYIKEIPQDEFRRLELTLALEIDEKLKDSPESDVRIMNHLPLAINGKIVTEGILIYCEDDKQRIEFETNTRMAYFDFHPRIRSYQRTFMEQLRVAENSEGYYRT